jgi:hypothetical protein
MNKIIKLISKWLIQIGIFIAISFFVFTVADFTSVESGITGMFAGVALSLYGLFLGYGL